MDILKFTDAEIVARGLELARQFYKSHGYEVPAGYRFYLAEHPQELGAWNLAVIAYENLADTDLDDALSAVDEDEIEAAVQALQVARARENQALPSWKSSGSKSKKARIKK